MNMIKIFAASMLSAMMAFGAVAAIPALAQVEYRSGGSQTSGNTTIASSNTIKLSGVISSLQNNEAGAPAWITSGHWTLESDRSVFDNATEPQVSNFSAIIYMTSLRNGTGTHQHEISDFRQTSILHSSQNVTTINGTMTISMIDGSSQNASAFLHLQNDMISIGVDQELEDHFGPTPVYGMIVPGHKMYSGGGNNTATAAQGGPDDRQDDNTTAAQEMLSDDRY